MSQDPARCGMAFRIQCSAQVRICWSMAMTFGLHIWILVPRCSWGITSIFCIGEKISIDSMASQLADPNLLSDLRYCGWNIFLNIDILETFCPACWGTGYIWFWKTWPGISQFLRYCENSEIRIPMNCAVSLGYKICISMISLANYCLYCIVVPQIEQ